MMQHTIVLISKALHERPRLRTVRGEADCHDLPPSSRNHDSGAKTTTPTTITTTRTTSLLSKTSTRKIAVKRPSNSDDEKASDAAALLPARWRHCFPLAGGAAPRSLEALLRGSMQISIYRSRGPVAAQGKE